MSKRLLALLLITVLLLSVAACGKTGDDPSVEGSSATEEVSEADEKTDPGKEKGTEPKVSGSAEEESSVPGTTAVTAAVPDSAGAEGETSPAPSSEPSATIGNGTELEDIPD